MLLHPFEQLALILQSVVQAQRRILNDFFAGEEAVRANSVIEVDHNHVSLGRTNEILAVHVCVTIDDKAASLDEDKDGQVAVGCGVGRRKYIGKETVL